jgi:steroid delta-isomerase-like uncharacterized protein
MNTQSLLKEYIEAYNAKDVSRMLSFFAEDCTFENISGGKVTVRTQGKAQLETLATQSAKAFTWREQKVISTIEGQGRLVAEIEFRALLNADLSAELKAGTELNIRGVSVFEISTGKILCLTDYS